VNRLRTVLLLILVAGLLSSCSNLDIQTLNQRAVELRNSGDIDGAIARLESIKDLNPSFPQTHYNLGIAYFEKKDYEKAIKALNDSINIKSNFAEAYYALGVTYENMALAREEEIQNDVQRSEASKFIVNCLNKSIEAYSNYLKYAKVADDKEKIQSKIEILKNDIKKYTSQQESE